MAVVPPRQSGKVAVDPRAHHARESSLMGRMVQRRGIEAIGQEAELNQHARHVRGAEDDEARGVRRHRTGAPFVCSSPSTRSLCNCDEFAVIVSRRIRLARMCGIVIWRRDVALASKRSALSSRRCAAAARIRGVVGEAVDIGPACTWIRWRDWRAARPSKWLVLLLRADCYALLERDEHVLCRAPSRRRQRREARSRRRNASPTASTTFFSMISGGADAARVLAAMRSGSMTTSELASGVRALPA